jgi:hypothetical protein
MLPVAIYSAALMRRRGHPRAGFPLTRYPVDPALAADGSHVAWDARISERDAEFARRVYPSPDVTP